MPIPWKEQRRFTERNIAFGERGTAKRRAELAGYAEMLQRLKDQGELGLLESEQRFERPEQVARIAGMGEETEGLRLENVGERFYQGLAKQYGPTAMRQDLGLPEPEVPQQPYAKLLSREFGQEVDSSTLPGISPKYDISSAPAIPEMLGAPAPPKESTWSRSTHTPVGRALDLENVTEALKKTWRGLDYVGRGMERGVGRGFKYLFTPTRRRRREDRRY